MNELRSVRVRCRRNDGSESLVHANRAFCATILAAALLISAASAVRVDAQQNESVVVAKEVRLVDSVGDWKPAAGKKLLWVKLEVTRADASLKSIQLTGLKVVATDKSEGTLIGYYLGDSSGPKLNATALCPGRLSIPSIAATAAFGPRIAPAGRRSPLTRRPRFSADFRDSADRPDCSAPGSATRRSRFPQQRRSDRKSNHYGRNGAFGEAC